MASSSFPFAARVMPHGWTFQILLMFTSSDLIGSTTSMMGYLFGTIFADDSWGEHVRGIRGIQAAGVRL